MFTSRTIMVAHRHSITALVAALPIALACLEATTPVHAEEQRNAVAVCFDHFIERQVVSGGVMLVAQHGKVVSMTARGLADIDTSRPMLPDTLFRIASMT